MAYKPSFGVSGEFLDYMQECEEADAERARLRRAGNFHPYYARKVGRFGFFVSSGCQLRLGRYAIYQREDDGREFEMSAGYQLGVYWFFETAVRIAQALQIARRMPAAQPRPE